ncbi:MAG: alpha/beta hydrolase [Gemmatimonadaceae bacterium]|nr:alpha/beta hydrolase [Gemmatimonadaceae bacterium]
MCCLPSRSRARAATVVAALSLALAAGIGAQARPVSGIDRFAGTWRGEMGEGTPIAMRVVLVVRRDSSGTVGAVLAPPAMLRAAPAMPVTLVGDTLVGADASGAQLRAVIASGGDSLRLLLRTSTATVPLMLARSDTILAGPSRPQTPVAPFPYATRTVTIPYGRGDSLQGTLTLGMGGARRTPAVLLIAGGDTRDRDGTLFEHRPLAVLADHLARSGIAALRVDRVASACGQWPDDTAARVAEARAALAWLRTQPEVASARVGIVAHAEGAVVAALVAKSRRDVAALALLAPTALRGDTLVAAQAERSMRAVMPVGVELGEMDPVAMTAEFIYAVASGRDSTDAIRRLDSVATAMGSRSGEPMAGMIAQALTPYRALAKPAMLARLRFDPLPTYQGVTTPVLVIGAEADLQCAVPACAKRVGDALARGGAGEVQVVTIQSLNHQLQLARTNTPFEPMELTETISPFVLGPLTGFLREKLRP